MKIKAITIRIPTLFASESFMGKKRQFANPENPEKLLKLRLHDISDAAAGITGVKVAVQHVFSEMGPARGLKALFNLNQKGGVDCPSCAWPDPDDDRSSIGEYCENGAKAIADLLTSRGDLNRGKSWNKTSISHHQLRIWSQ